MNKKYRIKKTSEIDVVFKNKKSVGNSNFVIYYQINENLVNFRFAVSIGKKYGNSVKRNLMKRRLREIFRINYLHFNNLEVVVVVKPGSNNLSFQEIKLSIDSLMDKIIRKMSI